MNWFKSTIDRYRSWRRKMQREGNSVQKTISSVFLFPIRLLFLPFKSLSLLHDSGVKTSNDYPKTRGQKVKRFFKNLLWLPVTTFRAISKRFLILKKRKAWKELAFITPAVLMFFLFAFVFSCVLFRSEVIHGRYKRRADQALIDQDFRLAKVYYQRLMSESDLTPVQNYSWAIIQSQTGNQEEAGEIMNELAPDDGIGLAPAHRAKALALVSQIQSLDNGSADPKLLENLKWHLTQGEDGTVEIAIAWAAYHSASENYEQAIEKLKTAAKTEPSQHLAIAAIHHKQGNTSLSDQAIETAAVAYEKALNRDPQNSRLRVAFVNVLVRLDQFDKAELVLRNGLKLNADPLMRRASSNFFVMQFDLAKKLDRGVGIQLEQLENALKCDPNDATPYDRIVKMYSASNESKEHLEKTKTTLQELIASGAKTGLVHVILSNVLWQEGKIPQAKFHLEHALSMDEVLVRVVNDMAWSMAHGKTSDLERALELSKTAVKASPNDARMRHTYGTILTKLGRLEEAVAELKIALQNALNPEEVHSQLAVVYAELKMDDLAALHRKQSQKSN